MSKKKGMLVELSAERCLIVPGEKVAEILLYEKQWKAEN